MYISFSASISRSGSGTIFKIGDPIHRYSSLEGIDVERLLALICKSFDKTLKQDYIASLTGRLHSVYLSEGRVQTIKSKKTTYLWLQSKSWSFPKHFFLHSDNKVV
ncbi:hypothetical protein JOQ06_015365 [Pogonophryne albipinna]|uniref:N-acetyltransferase domain-containing protein n=1 Tax=Pogonophryne albipinna TaxID=1090488 RepID=A0AAD6AD87_9TELE|nr:hypothetical protein JOQ06_015365 [Pogonophryne albipinna]